MERKRGASAHVKKGFPESRSFLKMRIVLATNSRHSRLFGMQMGNSPGTTLNDIHVTICYT
jgi:hypothetical protein